MRAVLAEGDALFLDEAFTGLDADTKKLSAEYILRHLRGRTVIAVSHSPEDAKLLEAERIELKKAPEV